MLGGTLGRTLGAVVGGLLGRGEAALPFELQPIPLPGPWSTGLALAVHSAPGPDPSSERTGPGLLLAQLKYGGELRLARTLGRGLAEALRGSRFDLVVSPPSSRRNGFGPATALATAVARTLGVRCLPGLICRTRKIAAQKELTSLADKRENVAGAFRVRRPDLVRGRRVLVVDDVYDSGATLEEACRALRCAGAQDAAVAAVTKTRFQGTLA